MQNFNEKTVIDRIIELRENFAGPRGKAKFAKALGISASTYSYYENDRIAPISILLRIADITNTDLHWLLTGTASKGRPITAIDRQMLAKLETLLAKSPDSYAPLMAFIDLLSEKAGLEQQITAPNSPPDSTDRGWIPILGRTAAGMVHLWQDTETDAPDITELDHLVAKHIGKDITSAPRDISVDIQASVLQNQLKDINVSLVQVADQPETDIVQFIDCKELCQIFPDAFALQVDGDSMSPRINDGDIVIVSPSVPAAQANIAIVKVANQIGVTCKLTRTTEAQTHLIPINERYDTKIIPNDQLRWALAVLCHVKI